MKKVQFTELIFLTFGLTSLLLAQSNSDKQKCYQVGEKIAEDVAIVHENGEPQRLLDLVTTETKLIYLVLFGGPSLNPRHSEGGLWCEDSFNDMPISNFNYRKYAGQGVQFIPVVCPPVYHERRFGYEKGTFLQTPDDATKYKESFVEFVEATKKLQETRVIPFEKVYFDPRFRLMFNFNEVDDESEYIEKEVSWLGKFKPCGDSQRYSTPTIWLLSPEGEILREPFYGNRYAEDRLQILFTVREVDAAMTELLVGK